jgi:hypothetical protein
LSHVIVLNLVYFDSPSMIYWLVVSCCFVAVV